MLLIRGSLICLLMRSDLTTLIPEEFSERGLRSCLEYRPTGRQHDGHQFSASAFSLGLRVASTREWTEAGILPVTTRLPRRAFLVGCRLTPPPTRPPPPLSP